MEHKSFQMLENHFNFEEHKKDKKKKTCFTCLCVCCACVSVCLHVCMFVSMHVNIYLCMHVSVYICIYVYMVQNAFREPRSKISGKPTLKLMKDLKPALKRYLQKQIRDIINTLERICFNPQTPKHTYMRFSGLFQFQVFFRH